MERYHDFDQPSSYGTDFDTTSIYYMDPMGDKYYEDDYNGMVENMYTHDDEGLTHQIPWLRT